MNNYDTKELEDFVEVLYPFIKRRLDKEDTNKSNVKMKNATVVTDSEVNAEVEVILPYDTTSFFVPNKTGEPLTKGDIICLMYWVDLKNAVAMFKVNS